MRVPNVTTNVNEKAKSKAQQRFMGMNTLKLLK